jgi:hypothetical protein
MTPHMGLYDYYNEIYKKNSIKFANSKKNSFKNELSQPYIEVLTRNDNRNILFGYRGPLSINFLGHFFDKILKGL